MKQKLLSLLMTLVLLLTGVGSAWAIIDYKGGELVDGRKYYVQNVATGNFISGPKSTSSEPKDAIVFTLKVDEEQAWLYTTDPEKAALNPYVPGIDKTPGFGAQLQITKRSEDNGDIQHYILYRRWAVFTWAYAFLGDDSQNGLNKKSDGNNNDAYTWRLIPQTEVNLTIGNSAPYGTFCAPFDVTIPNDVNAYKVTNWDSTTGELTLEDATTNGVLAAGTPVIVKGSAKTTSFYGLPIVAADVHSDGYLHGIYNNSENVPGGSYVLQKQNGKVAFYHTTNGFSGTPYRTYLTVGDSNSGPAKSISFTIEGESTSVSSISSPAEVSAVYSVSGAKLGAMKKGMNIIRMSDGSVKKVMVK